MIGGLQADSTAAFLLRRPLTGFEQIILYTVIARSDNVFALVYNATNFVAEVVKGSNMVTSTSNVFNANSVGKMIELKGINFGGIPGQTHVLIVREVLSARRVRVNKPWFGSSQVGVAAKIGTAWWDDNNTIWAQ